MIDAPAPTSTVPRRAWVGIDPVNVCSHLVITRHGEPQRFVTAYDLDENWVEVFVTDAQGKVVRDRDTARTERLHGGVSAEWHPDTPAEIRAGEYPRTLSRAIVELLSTDSDAPTRLRDVSRALKRPPKLIGAMLHYLLRKGLVERVDKGRYVRVVSCE